MNTADASFAQRLLAVAPAGEPGISMDYCPDGGEDRARAQTRANSPSQWTGAAAYADDDGATLDEADSNTQECMDILEELLPFGLESEDALAAVNPWISNVDALNELVAQVSDESGISGIDGSDASVARPQAMNFTQTAAPQNQPMCVSSLTKLEVVPGVAVTQATGQREAPAAAMKQPTGSPSSSSVYNVDEPCSQAWPAMDVHSPAGPGDMAFRQTASVLDHAPRSAQGLGDLAIPDMPPAFAGSSSYAALQANRQQNERRLSSKQAMVRTVDKRAAAFGPPVRGINTFHPYLRRSGIADSTAGNVGSTKKNEPLQQGSWRSAMQASTDGGPRAGVASPLPAYGRTATKEAPAEGRLAGLAYANAQNAPARACLTGQAGQTGRAVGEAAESKGDRSVEVRVAAREAAYTSVFRGSPDALLDNDPFEPIAAYGPGAQGALETGKSQGAEEQQPWSLDPSVVQQRLLKVLPGLAHGSNYKWPVWPDSLIKIARSALSVIRGNTSRLSHICCQLYIESRINGKWPEMAAILKEAYPAVNWADIDGLILTSKEVKMLRSRLGPPLVVNETLWRELLNMFAEEQPQRGLGMKVQLGAILKALLYGMRSDVPPPAMQWDGCGSQTVCKRLGQWAADGRWARLKSLVQHHDPDLYQQLKWSVVENWLTKQHLLKKKYAQVSSETEG